MNERSLNAPRLSIGGAVAVAAVILATIPASSFAAVTIGSDLNPAPDVWIGHDQNTITLSQITLPGQQVASPIDGVVVRWRMRTDGGAVSAFKLRVLRPNIAAGTGTGIATGPPQTPAAGSTNHTFETRLPINAGDGIGVDTTPGPDPTAPPGQPFGAFLADNPGPILANWIPGLADGESRAPSGYDQDLELLVNADVEPDADRDGYGDESQDACRTDAVPAGGPCTAPGLVLGGRRTQRAVRQKAVFVDAGCPTEACSARGTGTVSVPLTTKVYRLRPATAQIPQGGKARLRLKLTKKALKAVKRALARRKRVKAKVTVTVKDAGGNARRGSRTIRLRR
jgi:hypothetical protein